MAGKKISELTALTEITGQEMVPVARDGQNYSVLTSLLQGGDATRLNDYMYDVSELMGKMAVRGTQGKAQPDAEHQGNGQWNTDGTWSYSALAYSTFYIKPNHAYFINISYSSIWTPKETVAAVILFDKDGNVLKAIPATETPFKNFLVFTSEVYRVGVSYPLFDGSVYDYGKEYDIQDINDVLSTMNDEIEANTTSISAVEGNINTQQGNRALYVAAGAVYNDQTGFYELNGLTDITEEQMREIYVKTMPSFSLIDKTACFNNLRIRTNLPFVSSSVYKRQYLHAMFLNCSYLEVAFLEKNNFKFYGSQYSYVFRDCRSLKTILGNIVFPPQSTSVVGMFRNCPALVNVNINSINTSISFSDSPLLSLESLQYLITNATNTSAITVTVHADVYAKIQDETQADWHALIASAQEKNITFATA